MISQIEKWDFFEFQYRAEIADNPFLAAHLVTDFTIGHRTVTVSGFYDGDDVYRVRFMPDTEGIWNYITHSNIPALDGHRGELECVAPATGNHGPVRVIDQAHFAYADGTAYHPVGTTSYVWNHQGDALESQTLETLATSPFNKMRMCVFPKRYIYNLNEPPSYPFPGEVKRVWAMSMLDDYRREAPPDFWDFTHFNPEYFRHLEKHILDLRTLGIEADLILFHPYDFGAWGFDRMPRDVNDRVLCYLIARLAAFRNVWWSFANEYDLMLDRTMADWDDYFKLVQMLDPYDHLRSIHNWRGFYDHRKSWVTHCSIQHSNLLEVPNWLQQYGKPVVIDECGYEGDIGRRWGSLSAEEMVLRFWLGFAAGGYVGHGETYWNEEEVLWWAKGGRLHGESAPRIAFLRQIIESIPAPGLLPLAGSEHAVRMLGGNGSNLISAGYHEDDTFLFYFGMHQPRFRDFKLPDGQFHIDILDTWNMTTERACTAVSGHITVELPRRKYLALLITSNR